MVLGGDVGEGERLTDSVEGGVSEGTSAVEVVEGREGYE